MASVVSTRHRIREATHRFFGTLIQATSWPHPASDPRVHPFLPRSFAKPPKQVQTVCECILIMKGYRELNWKTAKGMMSDPNFLRSLMEIDFDSVTQSQVKNIRGECRQM